MPEGDNLARIAQVLGGLLVGRQIVAAGGRAAARLGLLVGRDVERVEARGKHLLIHFAGGLTLHTHLGLHGSWRHYRPGEPARRARARALAFLETDELTCACFNASTVELLETRAVDLHPALAGLGPDIAQPSFEPGEALRRLRQPHQAARALGEALLDQRVLAGLGNVYRSELCFIAAVHPETPLDSLSDERLLGLLERAAELMRSSIGSGRRVTTGAGDAGGGALLRGTRGERLYVYGRSGRPCRRCGSLIASRLTGEPARRMFWCPACQPQAAGRPAGSALAEEGQ